MTRLEKIIKAFNDYDNMAEYLSRNDVNQCNKLDELRNEVRLLIEELKKYGCRREH